MNENSVYEYLKNTSLIDIIMLVSKKEAIDINTNQSNVDIYYTTKDLIRLYPNVFSKYKIDRYIKQENLPYIKDGKERLFLKSTVEEWLKRKQNQQFYNILGK